MASDKRVILVVDDEPFILMAACDGLEANGFSVISADDAAAAMLRLAECPEIAAIFTDINMPGGQDGMDLARECRSVREDVAIIVTSGRPRPDPHLMPPRSRFMPKPYVIDEVAKMLEEALL